MVSSTSKHYETGDYNFLVGCSFSHLRSKYSLHRPVITHSVFSSCVRAAFLPLWNHRYSHFSLNVLDAGKANRYEVLGNISRMQQTQCRGCPWEANMASAIQEISFYRTSLQHARCQMSSIHALQSFFVEILCYSSSVPDFFEWPVCFCFLSKT